MSRREWAYPRIATVRHLPNYPNEDQAYRMLNRICEEAQETMERHDMFINVVAEFYPPDDSIYGVNAESGRLVRVRLREPHRRREFLPYDMVYGVFLHE
ncbi:hypothetical protein EV182_004560 [Spiromyces aspiralis]|uniref:Uncharacterized protein n=1 Tax=Spiromyces aspiralis TaxID=68401 RepID=A0ACC1HDT0_9FUNG|nr:hypothetical protein EV182_004560 [Spiromyces aspiralis]